MPTILIADINPETLSGIEKVAADSELAVLVAQDASELIAKANDEQVEVVILDVEFESNSGLELYQQLAEADQHLPVILVANKANSRQAIEATKLGALDYLVKPLDENELRRAIARALEIRYFAAEPITLNPDSPVDEDGCHLYTCPSPRDMQKSRMTSSA